MIPKAHRLTLNANILGILILLLCAVAPAAAQQESQYDRGTPPQHAAGVSPLSSYMSTEIGTVNLGNGALNIKLPLGNVGGRGFWLPLTLNYSSKIWSASKDVDTVRGGSEGDTHGSGEGTEQAVVYADYAKGDNNLDVFQIMGAGWSVGAVPTLSSQLVRMQWVPDGGINTGCYTYTLTKLSLMLPDKGEIELRDDLTEGKPLASDCSGYVSTSRGRRWHATDGSGIVYISDYDVVGIYPDLSGVVITADGTRYRFDGMRCISITDRNGNQVTISYIGNTPTTGLEVDYTDQLGRVTKVQQYVPDPVTGEPLALLVTLPGYNGQNRYYKIKKGVMNQHYRSGINPSLPVITGDSDPQSWGYHWPGTPTRLFSESYGRYAQQIDNRTVVTELVLPDNRSLRFAYNEFGEIAEVQMPTGGKVQYDYEHTSMLPAGNSSAFETTTGGQGEMRTRVDEVDRGVVEQRTYPDGETLETRWNYDYSYSTAQVTALSPSGAVLLNQGHQFLPSGRYYYSPSGRRDGTYYSLWSTGLEYRTETRDASGNNILAVTEQDWTQRTPVVWSGYPQEQLANDNRVNETRKILDDGKVARVTTLYDQYNNPTEVAEYDFDTLLKRLTVTTYLTTNPINGANYADDSIRLVRLPAQQSVYDSAGEQARTVFEYDNYLNDGNNVPLQSYSPVTGHDSTNYGTARSARGNVTRVARWLKSNNSYLSTFTRYDILGNPVSMKDPRNNVSTISYQDDFGDGNNPGGGVNGSNGPTYALPTLLTSPAPTVGAQQQTARSQYDFSTGLLTGFRDRNNVVAQTRYDDPFNRPTLTRAALGTPVESHSRMYYAPATVLGVTLVNNDVLTVSDLAAMDDAQLRSWTRTDGYGRTVESWTRDPQGDVKVQTIYDNLGRQRQTSNPFRPSAGESAIYTTTEYDALGRVLTMTTPDGAQVSTTYSGNTVTVTDQAGKQRRSVTDALGRLTQIIEAPNDANYNYQTSYAYDVLGNLTTVTQGVQTRTFTYDSLSRLTSATNPESGTIFYQYDANGNLASKTDARNVVTTYTYDALNRATFRDYSDSTPDVTYIYDTLLNGKGRLTSVSSSVSIYNYSGYDALGRVTGSSQVTDGVTYSMPNYQYDLAGNLTSQTYPSGRVVTTSYDSAGRLSQVSGQKTGEANKTYANSFSYTSHGAIKDVKLGNNLWEHTIFNTRLQPTELGLGTTLAGIDRLKLNYSYGTTTNNGNVQSQIITIPNGPTLSQSYTYDALNRLKSAEEMNGGSQSWKQTFVYDRFGNRNFDTANTTANALGSLLTIDQGNNRFTAGQGSVLYDNAGNLTRDFNGHTFGYDAENKQASYDGGAASGGTDYKYDGDGRRVKKVNGTTAQATTIFVYNAAGQLVAEYESNPLQTTGGTSYLTSDTLGTPRIITDSTGAVKARHDYLPFGEEIAYNLGGRSDSQKYVYGTGNPDNVRQKFTQKERDPETELDYFGARYYSSAQGRFTSIDPMSIGTRHLLDPQDLNRYVYVTNNPFMFVDPDGKEKIKVIIRTFIPDKTVTAPDTTGIAINTATGTNILPTTRTFAGDDRGVGGKGTFRTEQIIVIETDPKANNGRVLYKDESNRGHNGVTIELDSQGREIDRTTGSGDSMNFFVKRNNKGIVTIGAGGDESDPLVTGAPGISYRFIIFADSEGPQGNANFTIFGEHDGFPAYEIMAERPAIPNNSPAVIYGHDPRDTGQTPLSLFPPMEFAVFNRRVAVNPSGRATPR